MKLKKVKRGLINITDQSVNMGIIFIVLGIVAAVGYTVYSKFWAVNETNVISNIINEVRNMGEGNGGYGTANYNQAIINSEAISSKVKYSGTTIYNHSGGTITVVGANTGFTVTSTGLSKRIVLIWLRNSVRQIWLQQKLIQHLSLVWCRQLRQPQPVLLTVTR